MTVRSCLHETVSAVRCLGVSHIARRTASERHAARSLLFAERRKELLANTVAEKWRLCGGVELGAAGARAAEATLHHSGGAWGRQ